MRTHREARSPPTRTLCFASFDLHSQTNEQQRVPSATIVRLVGLTFFAIMSPTGPYRHIVCLKFKDDAAPEQISCIEKEFAALPSEIDSVVGFEWGTNVSTEDRSKVFTHSFVVTFEDKAGLEAYLPHAEHQAFVEQLLPVLDDAFVIDFVARS